MNNPIEFGVLTGFASMIPIVGSMLVWIPLAIVQYFEQGMLPALYISLYGIVVISQSDNVLRMIVQKRMADTHPLVTIFGVIAGLPLFGFMGLIFGPLLVAMFLLFLEMFIKQYITCEYANEEKGSNSRANSRQDKWALKNANPNAPQNKLEAQKKRPSQEEGVSGFGLLGKMMNRAQAKNDNAAPLKDSASKRDLKDNVKKRDLQDSKIASDGKLPRDSRSKASSALKEKSQDKTFNETKSAEGAKSKELKSQELKSKDLKSKDLKSQDNKSKDLRNSSLRQDKNVAADTSSTAKAKASAADNANDLAAAKDASAVKDAAASKNAATKNDFKSAKADAKHQKREAAKLRAAEEQKALERQMARDVLSNETRPAVNLAERFNERNEHLDNAGRTLVARAISDAIGSFDKFDDIEGSMQYAGTSDLFKDDYLTDETKAAIAKRHNRAKGTEDSVYGEPIKHSRTEAKSSKSSQDKRKGLDSKRQDNTESKSRNSDNVSASPSDSAKLDPYHTQGSSSTKAESNSSRHSDRQSRRQRNKEEVANASSSRNDKKTSTQKRTNERKQSAKDAPKGKAKSSRNNRRVNSVDDYYARSASRRSEYDMPMFETVVAHNYGGNGSSRRPQLRTQLVSMYTAKGTVKAEPRRRPSKKRPHHR